LFCIHAAILCISRSRLCLNTKLRLLQARAVASLSAAVLTEIYLPM
jgi:hypothetical protein